MSPLNSDIHSRAPVWKMTSATTEGRALSLQQYKHGQNRLVFNIGQFTS